MAEINNKWPWPQNTVGFVGTHPEEVRALQRRVEKNIEASPMPEVAPQQLLDPQRSGENLRFGNPVEADYPPESVNKPLNHVLFRRILSHARRRGAVLFDDAVEQAPLGGLPKTRRDQMRTMITREQAMLEILDRYNGLAEDVYMRLLAGLKG